MYAKKSPTQILPNSSSDDSGIYCTDNQFFEEAELLRKLQLEEEDNLTPLKKIQRKPMSYYKKQADKPSVKNLINKWNGKGASYNKNEKNKSETKAHNHQPNTYQTTFIRIWPSDYEADVRCYISLLISDVCRVRVEGDTGK